MAELIALAKSKPDALNYASSGHGAAAHLAGELFKSRAGVEMKHVAYKGAAPALQDVISGQVEVMFATAASVIEHIRAGTVRPLAVTTLKRSALVPELPTVDEQGLKGFDATTWHGLVAPAATPADVSATLYKTAVAALRDAAVAKSLTDLGVDVAGNRLFVRVAKGISYRAGETVRLNADAARLHLFDRTSGQALEPTR